MSFKIFKIDGGHVPAIEYLPAGAITPKVGMALTQSSGRLAIATGTTAPSYISLCERESACEAGEEIPVLRVAKEITFETTASAALTSVNLGDKVTLHASSGMQVTATTTSGVAEIVAMDGTAAGSRVLVRF